MRAGSSLAFVAHFLGRRLSYTYVVRDHEPGGRLVMSTEDGPLPMETTYSSLPVGPDRTRITLRSRGNPRGFSVLVVWGGFAAPTRKTSRIWARLLEGSQTTASPEAGAR